MDSRHEALLRSMLDGGSIPISNTVESQRVISELVDAGLVEIAQPGGQLPCGQGLALEYRLTPKGKAIAEAVPRGSGA